MASRPGLIRRFFGFLWSSIGFLRNLVLNLVFLAVVVALAVAWFSDSRPTTFEFGCPSTSTKKRYSQSATFEGRDSNLVMDTPRVAKGVSIS